MASRQLAEALSVVGQHAVELIGEALLAMADVWLARGDQLGLVTAELVGAVLIRGTGSDDPLLQGAILTASERRQDVVPFLVRVLLGFPVYDVLTRALAVELIGASSKAHAGLHESLDYVPRSWAGV